MKSYSIKITGGGTVEEIVNALHSLADSIDNSHPDSLDDGTFKDPYLCAEISEGA